MAVTIKAARVNAGKTQEEVGAHVGKSKNTIRAYETYKSTPDVETAKKMAAFYGTSVDEIIWSR